MSQTLSPFSLTDSYGLAANGFLQPGQSINVVRSLGADNTPDPVPLPANFPPSNLDQYVPSQVSAPPPTPLTSFAGNSMSGSVMVVVKAFNTVGGTTSLSDPVSGGPNDAVEIILFVPVNGVLTALYGQNTMPPTGALNANYFPLLAPAGTLTPNVTATFLSVPIGPRAVQAFQFDTTTGYVKKRSPLTYLMIPSGGVPTQTLILQ
jgi:hypothetical protein